MVFLIVLAMALGFWAYRLRKDNIGYRDRFSKVIDIEQAVADLAIERSLIENYISDLKQSYKEKKITFDNLVRNVAIYNEEIELAELGFYKPHYSFDTSSNYKKELEKIRAQQKDMLTKKTAIVCATEWAVHGSKAKGATMANRGIRLSARAFNNECDAAIANTSWNNAARIEQRIIKAFEAINSTNQSLDIKITQEYLNLKLAEFRLAYEYQEKKRQEKEEQAAIRQQMKEDAKLEQEMEAAIKEEGRYEQLLEKAKNEAEKSTGDKLSNLEKQIADLTATLASAHEKAERAKSMAQQTRAGHVYIISNVGAFGDGVFKIGMTRRLEPEDRVRELGDASVPFGFDIHAMIYSEDAPTLENALHKAFESHRINLVNGRKEFFKIAPEYIEKEVLKKFPTANFINSPEAREYKETLAILNKAMTAKTTKAITDEFPNEI